MVPLKLVEMAASPYNRKTSTVSSHFGFVQFVGFKDVIIWIFWNSECEGGRFGDYLVIYDPVSDN